MRFGIEVTGTKGPIGKDSRKLTQVLDFERLKVDEEKTILLANTFNRRPPAERQNLEHFTQPAQAFLASHPILLMTGVDLLVLAEDVLEREAEKEEIVEHLHKSSGLYRPP